ncbi:GLPGLI family protein [Flavobacterium hiemivividum]|uniref:GLPGLI family protein n=1 Tax=Flavobacterium hiemivividum TaxID=2541734 RepID=A0A4R5D7J5_9FLAO|nr:GLPGLI family protein [Flavobacterium hiemivividum]TDE06435.1 GLPGLI family protein [Flavobacterium hiemivividum]
MKYFFFSLLFTSLVYSQQSIIVQYDFQTSFLIKENTKEAAQKLLEETIALANNQKFELIFSKKRASFKLIDQLSIGADTKLINITQLAFTSPDVYSDLEAKTQITAQNDGTLIESKITDSNWEVTPESKTIGAYLCYKAIFNKPFVNRYGENKINKIVAWFAPNLPYSIGPKYFCGLPGLILEVTEYDKTYLASKIELMDEIIDLKFPKGKTVAKEDYDKKLESSAGGIYLAKKREKEKDKQ